MAVDAGHRERLLAHLTCQSAPALSPDTLVCWSQDADSGDCTLAQFYADNDGIEPEERAHIERELSAGRTYYGGGGAAAEWKLWADTGRDDPDVCAQCGGRGVVRHWPDALGLSASALREAEARARAEATPCPAGCWDWRCGYGPPDGYDPQAVVRGMLAAAVRETAVA